MLTLLIIADDFTGSLDTGVQFAKQGANTLVTTDTTIEFNDLNQDVEVLVIDTESRYLSFEEAYELVYTIMEKALKYNIPHIYKKVDSALRGNISAEIKAILDSSKGSTVPFLPAYPEMNRTLINGELYIDQVRVSESIFSDDPYEPVTESNVLTRLKKEADIQSQLVKGNELPHQTNGILVFDSQTDEELEQQLEALESADLLSITIGCAGFAKILGKHIFPNDIPVQYEMKSPLVVICGSVNPITEEQINYAEEKKFPRIALTSKQLLNDNYWSSNEGENELAKYADLLDRNGLVIFETSSNRSVFSEEVPPLDEFRFKIGESLGELTSALWERHTENTFLFTGGDTLFQSMKVLGVHTIKPIAEISAGVVLSNIVWNEKQMQVLSKSGGFGNKELLVDISGLTKNKEEEF